MKLYRWVVISALFVFWPGLVLASFPATETTSEYAATQETTYPPFDYEYHDYWYMAGGSQSETPEGACQAYFSSHNLIYYGVTPNGLSYNCQALNQTTQQPYTASTASVYCPTGWTSTGTQCRTTTKQCPVGSQPYSSTNCVSYQYTCNAGDTLSGSTCTHITYSCPSGATLSGSSCDWTPCPNPMDIQDPLTGQCTAPPDCPEGQIDINPDLPGAQCGAPCPAGTTNMGYLSNGQLNCGTPPTCQAPKVDVDPSLARAVCVEPLTCPAGQTDTDPDPVATHCVQNPTCPAGYVDINDNPQVADCRSTAGCPPGTHDIDIDPDVDWCIGDPKCGSGMHYEGGQCVNDNGSRCPPGTTAGVDDQCVPNTQCTTGNHWDGVNCVPDTKQCPPGTTLSGNDCVVNPPSCPTGTAWNGVQCAAPDGTTPPPPDDEEDHSCSYGTHWDGTQCAVGDPAGCTAGSHWTGTECGVNECGDGAWGLNPCGNTGTGGTGGTGGTDGTGGTGGTGNYGTGDTNGDGKTDGFDRLNDDLKGLGDKADALKTSTDRIAETNDAIKAIIEKIEAGPEAKELPASALSAGGSDGVGGVLDSIKSGLESATNEDGSRVRIFHPPSLEAGVCGPVNLNLVGQSVPIDLQAGLSPLRTVLAWYLAFMTAWSLFNLVSEVEGEGR